MCICVFVYAQDIARKKMTSEVFMRIANYNVIRLHKVYLCISYAHNVHKNDNKRTYLVVILLTIGGGPFRGGISGPSLYYIARHCSMYGCAVREEDELCVMLNQWLSIIKLQTNLQGVTIYCNEIAVFVMIQRYLTSRPQYLLFIREYANKV